MPPLWGLLSLITHKSIIDLSQDPLTISVLIAPDVRKTLKLEVINGHLICPCDFYEDKPFPALPSKQDFVKDPLGLSTWVVDNNPTDHVEKADTPPLFSAWTYPEVEDNQTCFDDCLAWQWPKECLQEDEQDEQLPVFADVAPPVTGILAPTSHAFASGGPVSAPTETFIAPVYPLSSMLAARPTFAKDTTLAVEPSSAKRKKDLSSNTGQNQKFSQPKCSALDFEFAERPNLPAQTLAYSAKTIHKSARLLQKLSKHETYKRKYRGLPPGTPIPDYVCLPGVCLGFLGILVRMF